tara:strand:+ start:580 stop:804 length:225 start_codon:yes stop_codon:yes gene_type:complete
MTKTKSVLAVWAVSGFVAAIYLFGFVMVAIESFKKDGDPAMLILVITVGVAMLVAVVKARHDFKKVTDKNGEQG